MLFNASPKSHLMNPKDLQKMRPSIHGILASRELIYSICQSTFFCINYANLFSPYYKK
nr:MAG TPA: hypothetical protein [Caudoviricetes sp.]